MLREAAARVRSFCGSLFDLRVSSRCCTLRRKAAKRVTWAGATPPPPARQGFEPLRQVRLTQEGWHVHRQRIADEEDFLLRHMYPQRARIDARGVNQIHRRLIPM